MRTRFEQRFVESGNDTGLRLRQFLRAQRELPGCPPLMLVCWDEIFFDLNDTDWGQSSGFGQNRIFAGLRNQTIQFQQMANRNRLSESNDQPETDRPTAAITS